MKPLVIEGLAALRDGHVLLEQIQMEIRSGQVTGIIADNPDRLNDLFDIIGGIEREAAGKVAYGGRAWSPAERRRGVGIARQKVSLVDSLSVLDNLFLSNNRLFSRWGFILKAQRRRHAAAVLRRLEVPASLGAPVQRVDPSVRVLLDVARVMIKDSAYMIFHGVTRAMSLRQYEAFQTLVRGWKSAGKAILFSPSNTEDVHNLVDRLYVLQGSQLTEIDRPHELPEDQLQDFFLGNSKKRFQNTSDPIVRARQQIDEAVAAEDLDFALLADAVAMSYDNFRRRFKKQVGQSPNQYFLSVKIEKAKELLLFTNQEIKDIALQVGFSDPYYFSRVFKERVGTSPIHFRNGSREEPSS